MRQPLGAVTALAIEIYRELEEGCVELGVLVQRLRAAAHSETDAELRTLTEGLLDGLTANGVVVGQLDEQGAFGPWSPDGAVRTVMREWEDLGRDPHFGDISQLSLPVSIGQVAGRGSKGRERAAPENLGRLRVELSVDEALVLYEFLNARDATGWSPAIQEAEN